MFTSRLGRSINPDRKIRIYRNLHKPGVVYSVLQDGKVVGYVDSIGLYGVKFIVSAAGRDRVRREGRKIVHAFLEGYVGGPYLYPEFCSKARYNPHRDDSFVDAETGEALDRCRWAAVDVTGVRYI